MRVSTLLSQQIGLRTMTSQESKMLHTMQQLASGKRVMSPADDPLAAAQAINVAQTQSMNARYATNRGIAQQNLASEENVLNNISLGLQEVLTRVVEAGNGAYSDSERLVLANVLKETYANLMGNANATDGAGQYVFSGDLGNVQPYEPTSVSATAQYKGNEGERLVQVAQTRQMPTGNTGTEVFSSVASGTQTYVARETSGTNAGSATYGAPQLINPRDENFGNNFTISFSQAQGDAVTYRIDGGDPVPYVDGDPIVANGVSIAISGTPANGDSFDLVSASNINGEGDFSVFGTLKDLITALETPAAGSPAAMAGLQNSLATASRKMNLHLDNVLTVRASVGARMNELDALGDEGSMRALNYQGQLSSLEDIDYREASTNIAVQQVALQAAELAYMKTQGLGLFSRG